jgi:rhodanese-related sulfurtransferase
MDGEISADRLCDLIESGEDVRVVDVRSPGAFRRGHIPDSENVPFAELTDRIEKFADADRVVTVCPHGKASQQAARLIGSFEDFSGRVDSLEPGIEGWDSGLETSEEDRVTAEEGPGSEPEAPF